MMAGSRENYGMGGYVAGNPYNIAVPKELL
jgi:hypothetical protein